MSLAKIKKGDFVVVISGKDRKKTGIVTKILPEIQKVIVAGINIATYHKKANPQANIEGGILKKEMPIQLSNVARCDKDGNIIKSAVKVLDDGKKILVNKKTGEEIKQD